MLEEKWKDLIFVAFDTETTGQYPITAEICEVAAVKWQNGKVIDTFQTLVKPKREIPAKVIKIHGITNEMVVGQASIETILPEFLKFIEGTVLMAHHAAFDLGFISYDLENNNIALPKNHVICTSLLSRKVLPKSPNHRLQTLVRYLNIEKRTAHRALEDSYGCLEVGLKCMEQVNIDLEKLATLDDVLQSQKKQLTWQRFSVNEVLETENGSILVDSIINNKKIDIIYAGGSKKGEWRPVKPMGLVRSVEGGDYLVAFCLLDEKKKRFYLEKISEARDG